MRILIASQSIPGHLSPALAVAESLRARGHEVGIYSGQAARAAVERCGLRHFPFDAEMDARLTAVLFPEEGASEAATAGDDGGRTLLKTSRLRDGVRRWLLDTVPHQVRDLTAILRRWDADVLVADVTLFAPVLILKDLIETPIVAFSPIPQCTLPGPDAPPWGPGLRRRPSAPGRLLHRAEQGLIDWAMSAIRRDANALREQYGLARLPGRPVAEYARLPLMIVSGAPEFDYDRRDLPASVQYVGPCERIAAGAPVLPWLEDLARRSPIVHVTEGTIHGGHPVVLNAAARGLADLPVAVVMTTGTHRSPALLGLDNLADNIRVEQFVAHEQLLPRTSVLVTTGSAGTVTKALTHGIPILIVPIGWEHPETARRIVDTGVGIRLHPRKCTAGRVRAAVQQLLKDPSYRTNARRIGAALSGRGGAARAAELIERVVSRVTPAATT